MSRRHIEELKARKIKNQNRAIELRISGKTREEIAKELKVRKDTVTKYISEGLKKLEENSLEKLQEERELDLRRLDTAVNSIWKKVEQADLKAVATLVKLIDTRAKLLGTYQANKIEHTGKDGAPIEINARHALIEKITGIVNSQPAENSERTINQLPEPRRIEDPE